MTKVLAEMWKDLPDEEKQTYFGKSLFEIYLYVAYMY